MLVSFCKPWQLKQYHPCTMYCQQTDTHTHTHTTVLQLCGICPGQPGWAGTRRNIHPLPTNWVPCKYNNQIGYFLNSINIDRKKNWRQMPPWRTPQVTLKASPDIYFHTTEYLWVVGWWHGYLSGMRCRFAYGPSDPNATYCLLLQEIQIGFWFYLSGTGLL